MNFTTYLSNSYINIAGTISTNGEGPFTGPGVSAMPGQGGSYGGSGGRIQCNESYFTNVNEQVLL